MAYTTACTVLYRTSRDYVNKHSEDMKLCEKYGFAASAKDKHSAIIQIVCNVNLL